MKTVAARFLTWSYGSFAASRFVQRNSIAARQHHAARFGRMQQPAFSF
jgi:hypothetical protein